MHVDELRAALAAAEKTLEASLLDAEREHRWHLREEARAEQAEKERDEAVADRDAAYYRGTDWCSAALEARRVSRDDAIEREGRERAARESAEKQRDEWQAKAYNETKALLRERAAKERAEAHVAVLREALEGLHDEAMRQHPEHSPTGGRCAMCAKLATSTDALADPSAALLYQQRIRREALEEAAEVAGEYREGDEDGVPDRIEAAIRALAATDSPPTKETE